MDLTKLLDLSYLFDPTPGPFSYMPAFVGLFLGLVLISFYADSWIRKQPNRNQIKRAVPQLGGRLRKLGLTGFVLLWFRYEDMPYLAIRFWLIALVAFIVIYLGLSLIKYKKIVPELEVKTHSTESKNKYLPRPKKHKKAKR